MTTTAETRRTRPRGSLIVTVVLLTLWAAWGLWYLLAADTNPNGQCEGLGFGCTITPRDFATFVGLLALGPLTGLVLLITGSIRLLRVSQGSPRTVWDLLVWSVLVLFVALVIVGTVSGAF